MKRLLAAGYPRIFQICRCFRKGERGDRHLSEFAMLEWYCAGIDYRDLMQACEDMVRAIARKVVGAETITFQGRRIELTAPWERFERPRGLRTPYPRIDGGGPGGQQLQ